MIEGMYKASFGTPLGQGHGIVVLRNGKIEGGDSSVYYTGSYAVNGDNFTAQLNTVTYALGLGNVFGSANATAALSGKVTGDTITVSGSVGGFKATLTLIPG